MAVGGVNSRWLTRLWLSLLLAALAVLSGSFHPRHSEAATNRYVFQAGMQYLVVEALDDDLLHFEYGSGTAPSAALPLRVSPMVSKTDYPGSKRLVTRDKSQLETSDLKATVDLKTLCVTVTDLTRLPPVLLTTACPSASGNQKLLRLTAESFKILYGLGEQFVAPAQNALNWDGKIRKPANGFGNGMENFSAGYVGNAQFPVLYALGHKGENYAAFIDSPYAQQWDFTRSPWQLSTQDAALRWYLFSGANLPDLRQDYMELVGRPPVPPKKFFGLWISEFGYDNWQELEDKLSTLRKNQFPVDGFVLDLQWYGGIWPYDQSQMANLEWDTHAFTKPRQEIADLARQGIGLMTIEEPFLTNNLSSYKIMAERGYLVKACLTCGPAPLVSNWWGRGGMIDWSNPQAGDFWFDLKRQPLISQGILGHWTDLGEPETYDPNGFYSGSALMNTHTQRDYHNLYSFLWSESIARGYVRNKIERRPFILSRSGTAGIQRFGTSLWSGDIASDFTSLAGHLTVQTQMSFSGVDYFGADVGGFNRNNLAGGALNDLYTKWLAAAALFDVPIRPHTENLCNCKETAPDRIGDRASNLANLRLRYALSPYYYSLAYRAYLYGEPLVPPLVYYYQDDPNTHLLSDEKLIGRDLLAAAITQPYAQRRDVYLPKGAWINYHTNEWIDSTGTWLKNVSAMQKGVFQLPLFARAGAILPVMAVDEQTWNMLGQRADGKVRDELIVRVYASPETTRFTLYEDDSQTIAYQKGQFRATELSQQQTGGQVTVKIGAAKGSYTDALNRRANIIQLITRQRPATGVKLNGAALPELKTQTAFDQAEQGWYNAGNGMVLAKSKALEVGIEKTYEFIYRK